MAQATPAAPAAIRGATVTTEDGGRLNAFAAEPRMEVVSAESGWGFHCPAGHRNRPGRRIVHPRPARHRLILTPLTPAH
jgi:hypothetical protein